MAPLSQKNPNPKLTKSPINEVIFEIRYEGLTKPKFDELLIKLKEELPEYSTTEDLNIPAFLPIEFPEVSNLVRYRFANEGRTRLYGIGNGIFSINFFQYESFAEFSSEVERLLNIHKELSGVSIVKRVGLRYINKWLEPKPLREVVSFPVPLPDQLWKRAKGYSLSTSLIDAGDTLDFRFNFLRQNQEIIIDLDNYQNTILNYEIEKIQSWITSAHDNIYDAFKASFVAEYFSTL